MKLPYLTSNTTRRDLISVFGGYNHNLSIPVGEFYDMKNLTSDYYPILAPRSPRGIFRNTWVDESGETQEVPISNPTGMILKDKFCYVDGASVVVGNEAFDLGLSSEKDMLPKRLVSMGAYLIVFPDQIYINTASPDDRGDISVSFSSKTEILGEVIWQRYSLSPCDESGNTVDAAGNEYSEESGYFILKCTKTNAVNALFESGFFKGQRLTVEALSDNPDIDPSAGIPILLQIGDAYAIQYCDISSAAAVYSVIEDGIVFKGKAVYTARPSINDYAATPGEYEYGFRISAKAMPEMDFIVEHENRLWGCRYGMNALGETVNEIYSSALGSFREWHRYEGVSTDSFTVGVGSDGPFTGAVTIGGYPYFFKERCYHKIYGSYPAQYQVQTTECKGIEKGSVRSAAFVNGVLFYKSIDAVCYFDGTFPVDISQNLGLSRYADAVAGGYRNKYYISMRDTVSDRWSLLVYDSARGLWHREDDLHAYAFCNGQNALYCIPDGNSSIITLAGDGEAYEGAVAWEFETGMIACETVDRKYLHRISVRMSLETNTQLFCFIEYDSSGAWEYMFRLSDVAVGTFTLPIMPRRCDHFRLKFTGSGNMKLFALSKSYSKGSDL